MEILKANVGFALVLRAGFAMKIIALAIALLFTQAFSDPKIKLEPGFVLPSKFTEKKKEKSKDKKKITFDYIATYPNQLRPFFRYRSDGVDYVIAYDKETRQIKYIHTDDKTFKTADGYSVGDCIEIAKDQVIVYPGWIIRGPQTKDSWYPEFGSSITVDGKNIDISKKSGCWTISGFYKGGN
jgi:hypothetical protein